MTRWPSASTKTRASMEPRCASWQMNGWAVATNGPAADRANAEPMQWVSGVTPLSSAVK